MAFTSLPERAKWIEGLLDLHPDSETLPYLKETIILELNEIKRLTQGFGKLPRDEFSSFRYWFAVQKAQEMETLLEMDESKGRKEKGHGTAVDDHSVLNVEAAATKDQNVTVVYVNWSCEDNGKNGK
jgi:hypothetical protein